MSRTREFFKFLFTGGLAAAVNFGSRFVYSQFVDFSTAVVLAYVTGMVLAFWLFSTQVFKNSATTRWQSTYRFVLVNLFGIFQTWIVSVWVLSLVGPGGIQEAFSHLCGMSLATVTSYFGHRFYTFRATKQG